MHIARRSSEGMLGWYVLQQPGPIEVNWCVVNKQGDKQWFGRDSVRAKEIYLEMIGGAEDYELI